MDDRVHSIIKGLADGEDGIEASILAALQEVDADLVGARSVIARARQDAERWQRQKTTLQALLSLYFAQRPQQLPTPRANDGFHPAERSRLVRQAALRLAKEGQTTLLSGDVIGELARQDVTFSIKRPNSMAGTVMTGMSEFERVGKNLFRFVGAES